MKNFSKTWDKSYKKYDNFLLYPNENVVRFVNKFINKRIKLKIKKKI